MVLGNAIMFMKAISTRVIAIFSGTAIGFFMGYLFSGELVEYVRRTAASDEDITQAAFLCIILVFPLASICGGMLGNILWKRNNTMKRNR